MSHSRFVTKWTGILLALVVFGVSARAADTNALADVNTNLPAAPDQIYTELTNSLAEQINAPVTVRKMSLQDCIELTLKHNLDLEIDRYNPQIALYTLNQQYGGYDPTLFLSGQHEHNVSGPQFLGTNVIGGSTSDINSFDSRINGLLPWGTTYTLEGVTAGTDKQNPGSPVVPNTTGTASGKLLQPLLKNFWIDSTRLAIRVDKNRYKYSQLELKLQLMQTITALEQAYYDLIYNRENVLVQEAAADQTDRLVVESKKKLEVGSLAPLDLASAEAQAAQNRSAIIVAKAQLDTQERKVKQLITENFREWADVVLQPTETLLAPKMEFNRQESWRTALAQRPEYEQAKLDAEKAGIQLKFDFNQLFPELDVFGTYGYNGSGKYFSGAFYDVQQRNRPFYIFGGQISLPLANIAARNTYKSGKVTLQQFVLSIKKQELNILIEVDNDIGNLQAGYDAVQATHAQRLYEEQALDAEQKKLENGKSTTYNVLLVQRDLTSARGAEIQALDTYNKDISQLSLDEGTTLERLRIDFEVK
jgi:outer membrane protein TolC